jgi:hypothetical protein
VHQSLLLTGDECYENHRNVACSFSRAGSGQDITFEWFSKFKSGMNTTENAICSGQPSINKKIAKQIEGRNIYTKREDSLSTKLIAIVNFIWVS